MLARSHLERILGDESLTRGLRDSEARMLVEWLVDQAEQLGPRLPPKLRKWTGALCSCAAMLARLRQFVELWFRPQGRGAACQLYAVERWEWPLPDYEADPYEVLEAILAWETEVAAGSVRAA